MAPVITSPALRELGRYCAYGLAAMSLATAPAHLAVMKDWTPRLHTYYVGKQEWMQRILSDDLGIDLSIEQVGILFSTLRTASGLGFLYPATRRATCIVMGTVILYGTYAAHRDERPLIPQYSMLFSIAMAGLTSR